MSPVPRKCSLSTSAHQWGQAHQELSPWQVWGVLFDLGMEESEPGLMRQQQQQQENQERLEARLPEDLLPWACDSVRMGRAQEWFRAQKAPPSLPSLSYHQDHLSSNNSNSKNSR